MIVGLHPVFAQDGVEPHLRRPQTATVEPGVTTNSGMLIGVAKPVEQSQLAPLPIGPSRASKWWRYSLERVMGYYNPVLDGNKAKVTDAQNARVQIAYLQQMEPTTKLQLSTFRVMPGPWDEGIFQK